jgi:hypothetical protein
MTITARRPHYPQLRLPTVWLEPDTYKHYLEWTDMYAHAEAYDYPQEGISLDDYSPFVDEVPADFKARKLRHKKYEIWTAVTAVQI